MLRPRHFVVCAMLLLLTAAVGYATPVQYIASLSGPNENPSNASPGTGTAFVTIDTMLHTLSITASFGGLTAPVSDAHIHCCIAPPGNTAVAVPGVGALTGFPLGSTSGTYANVFNTSASSTYRPAFITANGGTAAGAEAALEAGLAAGQAYFNIHTTAFPGGEIRGFLQPVPEPGTLGLLAAGLLGLVAIVRKRRS